MDRPPSQKDHADTTVTEENQLDTEPQGATSSDVAAEATDKE
eukprot:gene6411-16311_t